jgi:hypothetical protein
MLAVAVAVLLVGACGGAAATRAPTPEPVDPGYITKAEYGDEWPFTVATGTLVCNPSGNNDGRLLVTFDTGDGIQYALNGQAKDFGFPELDATILKDYPTLVGVLPLIERALKLCD